ncbi:MAG: DUF1549 domain-containing protein [Verrucomicrobiales bacterium]|nr:DUF1549 domain-containing protein [Verrucomicrobiales bacterium]
MTGFRYTFSCIFCLSLLILSTTAQEAKHWAYEPIQKPAVPAENGVDFLLARAAKAKGVEQNPEADRYTLLRRVSLNLTGLPPTVAEIEAFISDGSEDAYEKMVDRLLASPHYGERWGRHWLDVARYVQGKVKVPGVDRIDLAEEYRDYVVRSFNEDKPYDRFIAEQLAGDLLPGKDDTYLDRKIAPAFLSIGPWFDECTDPNKLKLDIADEQISTATKAFLGLDFACSRCHDHKFDPIPTRDYYAMAGIFRSTKIISDFNEFWKDGRPRLTQPVALPSEIEQSDRKAQRIEALEKQREAILSKSRKAFIEENEAKVKSPGSPDKSVKQLKAWEAEDFSGYKNLVTVEGKFSPAIETRVPLDQWVQYDFHLDEAGQFLLYLRYASPEVAPLKLELNRELLDERLPVAKTGGKAYQHYRWEAFGPFPFRKGTNRIRLLADKNEAYPRLDALKIVKDSRPAPETGLEIAQRRYSHSKTFWPPMNSEMELILPLPEIAKIDREIATLKKETVFKQTLAVADREEPIAEPVRVGGQTYQIEGDPVPRGVPTLFPGIDKKYPVPESTSGRVELAEWMTDPQNPLTARVMVNRVWHWHFGEGLVSTPDNFGIQGAPPSHPDLLDWLAAELIESGWSIKHIQNLIVKSRTYRRTSQTTQASPLTGFPRRRLEAEAIYDSMLGTLDKLVRQAPGSELDTRLSRDRALYILISSRSPKGLGHDIRKMFELFGFDASGRPIHDRPDAVTPDQALWFLNNPLPEYYATQLAEKLTGETTRTDELIETSFLTVLGHPPDQSQREAAARYFNDLSAHSATVDQALSRVILGLFSSTDFTHIY